MTLLRTFCRGLRNAAGWLLATPTRRKLVAAAVMAASLLVILLWIARTRDAAQEARQEAREAQAGVDVLTSARRADGAALANSDAIKRGIVENEISNSAVTEEALAANPDWANQPVPVDVLGSLRR